MVKQIFHHGKHQQMHGKVLNESWLFCLSFFFCLFIESWAIFICPVGVTINDGSGDRDTNSDILCLGLALMTFSSQGSFACHTCCDMAPQCIGIIRWPGIHVPTWDSNPRHKNQQIFTHRNNHCTTRATEIYLPKHYMPRTCIYMYPVNTTRPLPTPWQSCRTVLLSKSHFITFSRFVIRNPQCNNHSVFYCKYCRACILL
jgi:hypothetical protein